MKEKTISAHFLKKLNTYLDYIEERLEISHSANRDAMKSLQKYRTWISIKTLEAGQ